MRTAVRSAVVLLLALACAALIVLLTPAMPALPSTSDASTTANDDSRAPAHGNLTTPNGTSNADYERERTDAASAARNFMLHLKPLVASGQLVLHGRARGAWYELA